jgi:predicted AAA+ superfamily ATPase
VYYRRHLEGALAGTVSRNKVRLLFGARQTGKTELLRHLLAGESTEFYNLQEAEERRRFEADPGAFGRAVRALPESVRNVVIDEIQKVPALLDETQALYDAHPRRWQVYLTGSSARKLRVRSSNLLPGRSHVYHLYPVCLWETARHDAGGRIAPVTAAAAAPSRAGRPARAAATAPAAPPFPEQDLSRLLRLGCLPGVRGEPTAAAQLTLQSYVDNYLEEEIRREALIRDMGPFLVFLKLAAVESGRHVNLSKLSQESGVPASTLKTFYQVLADTFAGYWVTAYGRPSRKRLLTTPRFLLFDVGVRNAAAGMALEDRLPEAEAGSLLEQLVGQELAARAGYLGRGYRVSFWRTSYGVEVDYVWEGPRQDIPIEVKWTARPRPTDARHLETFLDEFPERAKRGFLVCRCDRPEQLTERVQAIPWHDL